MCTFEVDVKKEGQTPPPLPAPGTHRGREGVRDGGKENEYMNIRKGS